VRIPRLPVLVLCGLLAACVAVLGRSPSPPAIAASSCSGGYVALTFDDGPGPSTLQLLAALERSGLRATMFNTGRHAAEHPAHVRAEVDAGMWVENHTLTHAHLTRLPTPRMKAEIVRTQDVLRRLAGRTPTLLRPPYFESNARVKSVSRRLGLLEVFATVNSRDHAGASADEIVAAARQLRSGGIMLMHDRPPATIEAVPRIAEVLAERSLCTGRIARSRTTGHAVAVRP
jgi:peptidoglycan/xylan/chitin deacetylase (PgdA/CDA1 family)